MVLVNATTVGFAYLVLASTWGSPLLRVTGRARTWPFLSHSNKKNKRLFQLQFILTEPVKSNSAEQIKKPRIAAYRVKDWIYLEELQDI